MKMASGHPDSSCANDCFQSFNGHVFRDFALNSRRGTIGNLSDKICRYGKSPHPRHPGSQTAAADLLSLNTDKFTGHLEERVGGIVRKNASSKGEGCVQLGMVYLKLTLGGAL